MIKSKRWDEDDLLIDLKMINEIRKGEKLSKVDLEYFKNWKIDDNIKVK